MNREVINWLIEGPNWLKYAVEKQILYNNPNPSLAIQAIQDPQIQTLLKVLKSSDKGFDTVPAGKASYTREVFWYLFFLADIGFTARDLDLEDEFKKIMSLEDDQHRFVLSKEMKPDYFCISSILLSAMVRMSPKIKKQLIPHMHAIVDSQRLDGGWHCARSRAVGQKLQDTVSCPMDNLNVLLLMSQYEEFKNDGRLNGAIDLLLKHWEKKDEKWRPYGFGVGTDFTRLKYPAVKYGILRVLDLLSLFPYAARNSNFNGMLNCVREKSNRGKYYAESVMNSFAEFDFGQKKEPSRWITFLVERIERRIS